MDDVSTAVVPETTNLKPKDGLRGQTLRLFAIVRPPRVEREALLHQTVDVAVATRNFPTLARYLCEKFALDCLMSFMEHTKRSQACIAGLVRYLRVANESGRVSPQVKEDTLGIIRQQYGYSR